MTIISKVRNIINTITMYGFARRLTKRLKFFLMVFGKKNEDLLLDAIKIHEAIAKSIK